NIVIGGGSDQDQGLARPLVGPVASAEIHKIIENVVGNYLSRREGDETFLAFVRKLTDDELPSLVTDAHKAAA
ncbi:MAG: hypothetical protein AAF647_10775, partial [Pseudomonadota bacterium]